MTSDSPNTVGSMTPSFFTARGSVSAESEDGHLDTTAQTSPSQRGDDMSPSSKSGVQGDKDGEADPKESNSDEDFATFSDEDREDSAYHDAKKLPRELEQHCKIYLEEQVYNAAIPMLSSLLHHTPTAYVPNTTQITYLASLAIHPWYTNRPKETAHKVAGSQAMQYLNSLLRKVGPVNANMRTAFEFDQARKAKRRTNTISEDLSMEDDDVWNGAFVADHLVFNKAESFWKLVGWAFNCAALYPERWRYWNIWLKFMVNVLEEDYKERQRLDEASGQGSSGSNAHARDQSQLQNPLMVAYAGSLDRSSIKTMMRALFADGSASSLREFPQLFEREIKARTDPGSNKRKRDATLDLDRGDFGDYFDADSASSSPSTSPRKTNTSSQRSRKAESNTPSDGYWDSVPLRLRLFHLIGQAVRDFSSDKSGLQDVYSIFCNHLRSLPAPFFSLFVGPKSDVLDRVAFISILTQTLDILVPSSAPHPTEVDPEYAETAQVTDVILARCYLPYTSSNTADGNAKFSRLLEALTSILWRSKSLRYSEALDEAVRKGIAARTEKAKLKKGQQRAKDSGEDEARTILEVSSEILKMIVKFVKPAVEEDDDSEDEE